MLRQLKKNWLFLPINNPSYWNDEGSLQIEKHTLESNLILYWSYLCPRTVHALAVWNIITIKDLLLSKQIYPRWLKWLWKKWLKEIEVFIKYIKANFTCDWIMSDNQWWISETTESIVPKIYNSNLNLYTSYLGLRTINALHTQKINTVSDLFENKEIYLQGVKWLWKKGLSEIDNFFNYIVKNFSKSDIKNTEETYLSEIIEDDQYIK